MKSYSIGPLTGILKPKYRIISSILGEDYIPDNGLDIFIDLNTLVSSMASSQKFLQSLPFSKDVEIDIISSVLMILKHWKDFTRKWEDVRIFLLWNDFNMGMLSEQELLKSYMIPYIHKFQNDRFNQLVYYWNESVKRIEVILNYIPNSYFVRCNSFDSFVYPNIIDDYENNKRRRCIISGNSLMTNYHYMKNTTVIYTRYKHTGMCQISDPLMMVQSFTKIDDEIMVAFTKNRVFYNLLNAIIGDFDRGLIGLTQMGITRFANTLIRAVEKRDIPENPESVETIMNIIEPSFRDYIKSSYPLIDIPSHSVLIKDSLINKSKSLMIDKYDIDGLRELSINGLNLLELL